MVLALLRYNEITIPRIEPEDVLIKVAYEAICVTDFEILDGTLGLL